MRSALARTAGQIETTLLHAPNRNLWKIASAQALARLDRPQQWAVAQAKAKKILGISLLGPDVVELREFDPNQPRDEHGRWTDTGAGDGGGLAEDTPGYEPELDPEVVNVGGDKWNKDTAVHLEREYQMAKPKLTKIESEAVGKYPRGKPPSQLLEWSELSKDDREDVKNQWMEKQVPFYHKNEVGHWKANDGVSDAKDKVTDDFNDRTTMIWAAKAINEYFEEMESKLTEQADRPSDSAEVQAALHAEIPFEAAQLLDAVRLEYDRDADDPAITVKWDDSKLQEPAYGPKPGALFDPDQQRLPGIEEPKKPDMSKLLTDKYRKDLAAQIELAAFEEVKDVRDAMEPPEYLLDAAKEAADADWEGLSDNSKLSYAQNFAADEETRNPPVPWVRAVPESYDPLNETVGLDYKDTQGMARHMSIERAADLLIERDIVNPANRIDIVKRIASMDRVLWEDWKSSSTTQNGKLLQIAVADELNGRLNMKTRDTMNQMETKTYANKQFKEIGGYAGVRAYVRAKWETTQFMLDKADVKELSLYRSIDLDMDTLGPHLTKSKEIGGHHYLPSIAVQRNGAASTTIDSKVANDWGDGQTRVVLRALVPRTAAVSVPAYGVNIQSEHEVVIAGTAWKGWDAWHRRAPSLLEIELQRAA